MRETGFWNIFGGVNRHSSFGDRVAKVDTGLPSYLRLLGGEATSIGENDHDESIANVLSQNTYKRIKNIESGQIDRYPNLQRSFTVHKLRVILPDPLHFDPYISLARLA